MRFETIAMLESRTPPRESSRKNSRKGRDSPRLDFSLLGPRDLNQMDWRQQCTLHKSRMWVTGGSRVNLKQTTHSSNCHQPLPTPHPNVSPTPGNHRQNNRLRPRGFQWTFSRSSQIMCSCFQSMGHPEPTALVPSRQTSIRDGAQEVVQEYHEGKGQSLVNLREMVELLPSVQNQGPRRSRPVHPRRNAFHC